MTITFQCDSCGAYMAYEDERSVMFNSIDRDRRRDLCPKCAELVNQFIEEEGQSGLKQSRNRRVRK